MTLAFIFSGVGAGEWFVLLAVLLIVVGPKRLPETARTIGKYYSKFRRAAENFKRQLLDMDTDLGKAVHEVQQAANEVQEAAASTAKEIDDAFTPTGEPVNGD